MTEIGKNRTFREYIVLWAKGFCMGAADVVPGVSGGTMAFILGIYQELIESIKSVDLKCLRLLFSGRIKDAIDSVSWKFLVAVAAGILTAIFSIAKLLSYLLETHPVLIWSFFFGLVAASVVTICMEITTWRPRVVAGIVAGTAGAYALVGLVPAQTPDTAWFLFLSGALAICAMILPGISGAFVLVLLGKYHYVLNAVNDRDFLTLFIVAAGAAVGLMSFVRLLHWLFHRYHQMTIAILAGLLIGSLRKIWPWKTNPEAVADQVVQKAALVQANIWPERLDGETVAAIGMMVLGVVAVLSLEYAARREGRAESSKLTA